MAFRLNVVGVNSSPSSRIVRDSLELVSGEHVFFGKNPSRIVYQDPFNSKKYLDLKTSTVSDLQGQFVCSGTASLRFTNRGYSEPRILNQNRNILPSALMQRQEMLRKGSPVEVFHGEILSYSGVGIQLEAF